MPSICSCRGRMWPSRPSGRLASTRTWRTTAGKLLFTTLPNPATAILLTLSTRPEPIWMRGISRAILPCTSPSVRPAPRPLRRCTSRLHPETMAVRSQPPSGEAKIAPWTLSGLSWSPEPIRMQRPSTTLAGPHPSHAPRDQGRREPTDPLRRIVIRGGRPPGAIPGRRQRNGDGALRRAWERWFLGPAQADLDKAGPGLRARETLEGRKQIRRAKSTSSGPNEP